MDEISTDSGLVKFAPRCMPEFKMTQSKSGWVSVMLSIKFSEDIIMWGLRHSNSAAKPGIFASSVMSN